MHNIETFLQTICVQKGFKTINDWFWNIDEEIILQELINTHPPCKKEELERYLIWHKYI